MKIVIIGTGKVATQLGNALKKAGHAIVQVFGRNIHSARLLAGKLKSEFTSDIKALNASSDVYLIAISDSAIEKIVKKIPVSRQIFAHTSGSISMQVFGKKFLNQGVFYPLQTITTKTNINFETTPICIEAANEFAKKRLLQLAKSISSEIYFINSKQRSALHLAAVFANNFSNHLFAIAEDILATNNLSFEMLQPLIHQTVQNIRSESPSMVQTGPASRNDIKTIRNHLKELDKSPSYRKIYKEITESIIKTKK
ncbi:MAG: Rossmann-like and DUF2520 domain-containing protein [Bacteroidia bacterium]